MIFDVSLIHLIGLLVGSTLLYQSYRLVDERKEGIFEFLFWTFFGLGLLAISLGSALSTVNVLRALERSVGALGLAQSVDSIFFISNLSLLFIIFYTYTQLVESRKQISDLNQEVALLRYEFDQQSDDEE